MRTLVPLELYVVNNREELGEAAQDRAKSVLIDVYDNEVLVNDYCLFIPPRDDVVYPALISFSGGRDDDYVQVAHFPMKDLQDGSGISYSG